MSYLEDSTRKAEHFPKFVGVSPSAPTLSLLQSFWNVGRHRLRDNRTSDEVFTTVLLLLPVAGDVVKLTKLTYQMRMNLVFRCVSLCFLVFLTGELAHFAAFVAGALIPELVVG